MKRIYFAGKIKDGREDRGDYYYDWRGDIIGKYDKSEVSYKSGDGFYSYGGPIYYQEHGMLYNSVFGHNEIAHRNITDITKSDILFVYINSEDCFGTLAEIGFAYGLGIPVHIYYTRDINIKEFRFSFRFGKTSTLVGDHLEAWDIFYKKYIYEFNYKEYLKSDHRKQLSTECKERSLNKCQLCNSEKRIEAHHRSYKNIGNKELEMQDIIVVCHKCHSKFHDKPE